MSVLKGSYDGCSSDEEGQDSGGGVRIPLQSFVAWTILFTNVERPESEGAGEHNLEVFAGHVCVDGMWVERGVDL